MLRDTQTEGIVKKGHATTLHSLIRISRKFRDRISEIEYPGVSGR